MGLRGLVQLAQQHAGLHPGHAGGGVDADPLHQAQVHHQPVVAHRQPREAVAAAAHRDGQPGLPREPQRRHHVVGPGAARHQRRAPVDRAVPDLAVLVVGGVARADELPGERTLQGSGRSPHV